MSTPTWGDEFLVNTTTAGNQLRPSVAALANGQYVAVWQNETDILARVFHADGTPATGEIPVNTTTPGFQGHAVVTGLDDGQFVVAWDGAPNSDIVGRIFNLDGSSATAEFTIAAHTNALEMPAIAALPGGGFVATWQHLFGGTDSDIHASVFDANGSQSGPFTVDSDLVQETNPVVTGLAVDRYVIVWTDQGSGGESDGSGSHIRARIYQGTQVVEEFIVNSTTDGDQHDPAVAQLTDGRFVVSWTDGNIGIRARVFDNDGTALADDFVVSTDGTESSVTGLDDGRYLFTFSDEILFSSGIYGVVGDGASGNFSEPGNGYFAVNLASGLQDHSATATLTDGRVVALWTDLGQNAGDTTGPAVRGQILDPRPFDVTVAGVLSLDLPDEFIGTAGSDLLKGGGGDDVLDGGEPNGDDPDGEARTPGFDTLDGGEGNDILIGGREHGQNLLIGGPGADQLIGGIEPGDSLLFERTGSDVASYEGSDDGVDVNLETGIGKDGDAAGDQLFGIEGLIGSAHPDELTGDELANFLSGGGGGDVLKGGGGTDALRGEAGNDGVIGGTGVDFAVFEGERSDYAVTRHANGTYTVSDQRAGAPDGTDTVFEVEYLMFSDGTVLPTVAELADVMWQDSLGMIAAAGRPVFPIPSDAAIRGTADFDGDGDGDLLVHSPEGHIAIGRMANGEFGFDDIVALPSVGSGWQVQRSADFDADGDADILWRNNGGQVVIWEIEDGGFVTNHNQPTVGTGWQIAGAGDFDGDGDADILWRGNGGEVVTWEIEDGNYVTHTSHGTIGSGWQVRGTGDFDADGDADILWHNNGGAVVTWDMEDGDYVTHHTIASASTVWQIQGTHDFDDDGDADILWRHSNGAVVTWEMEAGALVTNHNYGVVSNEWHIRGTGEFPLA